MELLMHRQISHTIRSELKTIKIILFIILRLFWTTIIFVDKFFGILLVFASFLQTYDIYSSHILFFYFFLLQKSFCIYVVLVPLISLSHFNNNLLLYLVSRLGFFDHKLSQYSHSFSYFLHFFKKIYNEKFHKTLPLSTKLEPFIMLIASYLLIYQKWIL